jgi:NhaA family Na+:H+ antiporter
VFILLGCVGWFALHESGVHATIIGVAFAMVTPAYALLSPKVYPDIATSLISEVVRRNEDGTVTADEHELNDHTLREIRRLSLETQSPLHRVETRLAPYVAFGIVPLFAFANAGLPFPEVPVSEWATDPVVLGVALGLVVGKTVGIFSAAWLTVRSGLARYPSGMTQTHLLGVSMTAGIGFTVAIFVANLAFEDHDLIELAKLGIMVGSLVAALAGYAILRLISDDRSGGEGGAD